MCSEEKGCYQYPLRFESCCVARYGIRGSVEDAECCVRVRGWVRGVECSRWRRTIGARRKRAAGLWLVSLSLSLSLSPSNSERIAKYQCGVGRLQCFTCVVTKTEQVQFMLAPNPFTSSNTYQYAIRVETPICSPRRQRCRIDAAAVAGNPSSPVQRLTCCCWHTVRRKGHGPYASTSRHHWQVS